MKAEKPSETDIPAIGSSWVLIREFALTFDGYRFTGSSEPCAKLANTMIEAFRRDGKIPEQLALEQLRTCLFFEQRRWHDFGSDSDADALRYIQRLVDAIRDRARVFQATHDWRPNDPV